MSNTYINADLRRQIASRASRRCEYCLIHEDDTFLGCQVDHVISEKHGGLTQADNLALSCVFCNRFKGSDIATLGDDGILVPLFNPRSQQWHDHFEFANLEIRGVSPTGRGTAMLLRFNEPGRIEERRLSISTRDQIVHGVSREE
jgi:hypothetical protein